MNISKNLVIPMILSSACVVQPALGDESGAGNSMEKTKKHVHEAYESGKEMGKETWTDVKEESKEAWADVKRGSKKAWVDAQSAFDEGVIAGKLETAFIFSEALNPFDIKFDVEGDKVVINGEVDSEVDKELATSIAEGIDGVNRVENNLVINEKMRAKKQNEKTFGENSEKESKRDFSQYVSDVSTTASIKTELLGNDLIKGLNINVDTYRDVVTLTGEVDSEAQKLLAENIAKKRQVVSKVINRIKINS